MDNEYPRVLIISPDPFNYLTGLGITLSNLFKGWPQEKLACIYYLPIDPNNKICRNYLKIDKNLQLKWRFPLNLIFAPKSNAGGGISLSTSKIISSTHNKLSSLKNIIKRTLILAHISSIYILAGRIKLILKENWKFLPISDELKEWVSLYKPDAIYCTPVSMSDCSIILSIARYCKTKVFTHILDDWPSNPYFSTRKPYLKSPSFHLRQLLKMSTSRITIGETMREEYKKRYGLNFLRISNCPESKLWIENGKKDWHCKKSFEFVFTGALYNEDNERTLRQLALAIELVNKRSSLNIKMKIYTTSAHLFKFDNIRSGNFIFLENEFKDQDKIAKIYGKADGLIIAFGFREPTKTAEKLSIPTKLPAYLLSGTPILICAPESSAVSMLSAKHRIGYVLPDIDNIDRLSKEIEVFCKDEFLRKEIGLKAREYAAREFDGEQLRREFFAVLSS